MSSALPVSRPRMIEPESGRMQPPLEHSAAPHVPSVHMSRKWTDSFGMQVARVAGGVKRGLGLGRPTHTVMNLAAAAATPPSGEAAVGAVESLADLGLHLQRAALGLFGDFVTTGQDGVSLVDYDAMRSSESFAQYLKLTDKLRSIQMQSPADIGDRDAQLAFWLNLCVFSSAPTQLTPLAKQPAACVGLHIVLTSRLQVQLSRYSC
jgi:hypothetical protein